MWGRKGAKDEETGQFQRHPETWPPPPCLSLREQLTIDYYQRQRGTKRMVDMFFEFTELCTTIPPLEYGGNEVLLDYFASKVTRCETKPWKKCCSRSTPVVRNLIPRVLGLRCAVTAPFSPCF